MALVTRYDAVVIGAGFAGLSAAVRLARRGAKVLVLEARARLGGRATAFEDRESGETVDNGQHIMLGCYTATFEFLGDIGAIGNVRLDPQLAVTMIDQSGRRTRLSCPSLPPPINLLAGVLDWDALGWRDRAAILRMRTPLALARKEITRGTGTIAASPGETVENWLIRNGQTARLRELLWDPLALAALNQPPAEAAAPAFARVLAEMFGPDPRAASIALPAKPLDQMYAEPARAYIEAHGGLVKTGSPATVNVSRGVAEVASGSDRWTAAGIVVSVPWFAVADVFQGELGAFESVMARARRMTASPIVTVNLWFDRPLFPEPFIGLPGRMMQWVFDKRTIAGGTLTHLSLVSSGAAAVVARTNEDLVATAYQELLDALPDTRTATLLKSSVIREPRATFSLAPGQPDRPDTETPIPGVFLAGDWIKTGLPATIESAVRSGHLAAAAVSRQ